MFNRSKAVMPPTNGVNEMTNEVKTVPAEVTSFLSQYHSQSEQLAQVLRKVEDQDHLIATLYDQIDGYRKIIEEVSAKSDYYMRLAVEMRTHFSALGAMTREAEKCFTTGPYRNNGAVPKEALQVVADDINSHTEVKEIPGFLTDENRTDKLTDLKGEPKMPKAKGWPVKENGNGVRENGAHGK